MHSRLQAGPGIRWLNTDRVGTLFGYCRFKSGGRGINVQEEMKVAFSGDIGATDFIDQLEVLDLDLNRNFTGINRLPLFRGDNI